MVLERENQIKLRKLPLHSSCDEGDGRGGARGSGRRERRHICSAEVAANYHLSMPFAARNAMPFAGGSLPYSAADCSVPQPDFLFLLTNVTPVTISVLLSAAQRHSGPPRRPEYTKAACVLPPPRVATSLGRPSRRLVPCAGWAYVRPSPLPPAR